MDKNTYHLMERIVSAIAEAGYVPYDQLTGFLKTQDDRYITRHGNARNLIQEIDRGELVQFVVRMKGQH